MYCALIGYIHYEAPVEEQNFSTLIEFINAMEVREDDEDTDDSFNFLISMCYTQLFNLLCEKADDVYGGRLPVHVRCLIDECANIGQIPKLEKLVATIRSREISACLVLQAQSQLKAIYKDNADTIIGNMDTSIFLGGKEPTTLKELAAVLGKGNHRHLQHWREPWPGNFPLSQLSKIGERADEPG